MVVNYFGMAVNYCGILTLEKIGLQLLWYWLITFAPGLVVKILICIKCSLYFQHY